MFRSFFQLVMSWNTNGFDAGFSPNRFRAQPRLIQSISMTTRLPRSGERNGSDYRFVSRRQFEAAIRKRQFLEHARILGEWYGTPKSPIERAIRAGRDVLLGVDIQGARQIRAGRFPTTTIFLLPPSLDTLRRRLKSRGTESRVQIRSRLRLARRELREVRRYDYAVINDRLQDAIGLIQAIMKAEKHRVKNER